MKADEDTVHRQPGTPCVCDTAIID